MKLIWLSTAPYVGVGYGVSSKDLLPKMVADGHEVTVATKHPLHATFTVDGIEIFDGCDVEVVNNKIIKEDYDYLISYMDVWPLEHSYHRWVAVNLLDTEWIHPRMVDNLNKTVAQIAVTKHGKSELERANFFPYYAPIGVNTKVFKPEPELRKRFRDERGWSDATFVIGMVGINYSTDRKNTISLIRAFQAFHTRHPNSVLYLHTDISGSTTSGNPLHWVISSCGFPIDGSGAIQWVDQDKYKSYVIDTEEMVATYNGMDVMCLPSKGEGFGMPWTEAQACGTPIISADTTSGRELNFGGWVIPRTDDDFEFSTLLTYYVKVRPAIITKYMERAYKSWESGDFKSRQKKALKGALDYDWDIVYEKYWRPALQALENKQYLIDRVPDIPNYKRLNQRYTGRLISDSFDCNKLCNIKCREDFPTLPGEADDNMINPLSSDLSLRPMLSRLYPIFPDTQGNLLVSTNCPAYNYLSPRFKNDCRLICVELFTYPEIRKAIEELWCCGYFHEPFVPISDLNPEFGEEYSKYIQGTYKTEFTISSLFKELNKEDTILDVGAGDGERVSILRASGYNAIGCELNKSRLSEHILYGDMHDLPFEDKSFDVVMSFDVLEHSSNVYTALKEMTRIARKRLFLVITPNSDPSFYEDPTHLTSWSLNQWIRELREYGTISKIVAGAFVLIPN